MALDMTVEREWPFNIVHVTKRSGRYTAQHALRLVGGVGDA